jgi:hypothetical protein
MKFHSQGKNQRNIFRGCNRLRRIRMGEEKSLKLRVKLNSQKEPRQEEKLYRKTDQLAN